MNILSFESTGFLQTNISLESPEDHKSQEDYKSFEEYKILEDYKNQEVHKNLQVSNSQGDCHVPKDQNLKSLEDLADCNSQEKKRQKNNIL
jgi:hypothetical protein